MNCITTKANGIEVFRQNKRSARFINAAKRPYDVGVVDGCIITDGTPRCDNFLRTEDVIWLIELKGKDVEHAVEQIVSSTHALEDHIENRSVEAVIVATKCPAVAGQEKALMKLKNCKGGKPKLHLRTGVIALEF